MKQVNSNYIDALSYALTLRPILAESNSITIIAAPGGFARNFSEQSTITFFEQRRSEYLLLEEAEYQPVVELCDQSELFIVAPSKANEETKLRFAAAFQQTKPGGYILIAIPNTLGSKSIEKWIWGCGVIPETHSKYHCRILITKKTEDLPVFEEFIRNTTIQSVKDSSLLTTPGVFAGTKIDTGSRMLIENLPEDLKGSGADFGSGNGYLSFELLQKYPEIQSIHLFENNLSALNISKENLKQFNSKITFHWHDLLKEKISETFDWILMNPPFHKEKEALPEIGKLFIQKAAFALKPGGSLYLVANRSLPYEQELQKHFQKTEKITEKNGFKILVGKL